MKLEDIVPTGAKIDVGWLRSMNTLIARPRAGIKSTCYDDKQWSGVRPSVRLSVCLSVPLC